MKSAELERYISPKSKDRKFVQFRKTVIYLSNPNMPLAILSELQERKETGVVKFLIPQMKEVLSASYMCFPSVLLDILFYGVAVYPRYQTVMTGETEKTSK